ncbi:EscU/YscU/HrcU family type III secretion system export apparatus switch protein [Salinibacillus xinjiangensis]|uniref:Type III secretion system protein n=1 Tax=Salinibacillus xinjiangensis TaxID=1229268 RepID=A0A6G1X3D2_9BACI|nr:EscU/YscU/HrcU family type III secretion system export apparatus switch protein [Salinibacillus xinjiangensis]MRG85415.1 hypothetical protein [Salinibacillus xinjiangensis]
MNNDLPNKRKQAVALSYHEKRDTAPKVVAKGKGTIAENIIDMANENNVPVEENAALVDLLSTLNTNDTIPEELYQVVAEVFAFIYQVDKQSQK